MSDSLKPPLDRLDPRYCMSVLAASFGLGEQAKSIVHRLAGEWLTRGAFPIIAHCFLGIFERITLVSEKVLYQLADLHVLGTVLAHSPGCP